MNKFSIPAGDFDLELTMTCGQTFCWHRVDGKLYEGGESRFHTVQDGKPILVEQKKDVIEVKTELSQEKVEKALGVHKDLNSVFNEFPEDEKLDVAKEELWGLRIIQDEFFPCLISYLCSPQMRIPRIKEMHNQIAEKYGEKIEFEGIEMYRFPMPEELAEVSEDELRDLGVGYRAKYIVESTKIMLEGFDPEEVRDLNYEDAREKMKDLYGVGDKVADCVLLFSLGFHEAFPLDTWGKKAVKKHYPEHHSEKYDEVSRNMRERFGEHAGYAQEYIFHAVRNEILET